MKQTCLIFVLVWLLIASSSHAWTTSHFSFLVQTRSHHVATTLNLFYKPPPVALAAPRKFFVPDAIEKDWNEGIVEFPYSFTVAADSTTRSSHKSTMFTTSKPSQNATLTIRLMGWKDLEEITQMCFQEYSTYSTPVTATSSPWDKFCNWLDNATLGPYVALSMVLKLILDYTTPKLPNDHAVLVASLRGPGQKNTEERLVGMVEVSRQPPSPERNPPAIPFPLWLKETYSQIFQNQPTQGWITNLLIVPEYRGRGWAKALVMACEGVARCWSTSAIGLHCDASYSVPQKLYRSLGYRPEAPTITSEYSWMSNNDFCQTSIFIVDGVPLLYLCKKLL